MIAMGAMRAGGISDYILEKMQDKDVAVLSFYSTIASASENIETNCDITVNKLKELCFAWPKIKLGYLKYLLKI